MKYEKYQVFFDTYAGLIPGTMELSQREGASSGRIIMDGHPLDLCDVAFTGDQRSFSGTLKIKDQSIDFNASGELDDGVLDIKVRSGYSSLLLTGFLIDEQSS